MTSFEAKLARKNALLKASKLKVSIYVRGGKLWLRASLPPRPGSSKTRKHPQAVATGYNANAIGLEGAVTKAKLLSLQVATDSFDWSDWVKAPQTEDRQTVSQWVEAFEADYFQRRGRTYKTETTWTKDYKAAFTKLDGDRVLDVDHLLTVARTATPDTKTRKRLCRAYRLLLDFAKLVGGNELQAIAGSYSRARTKELVIPSDDDIWNNWGVLPTQEWQLAYGLLCCYGLRPSEVFFTDLGFVSRDEIEVESSKTRGTMPRKRTVWPICPDEWMAHLRSLGTELPDIKLERARSKIGRSVTERFGYSTIPYAPYALRHAYAVRGILWRAQDSVCAKWMGHSLKIHCETYQKWMDDRHSRIAYQAIKPPSDSALEPNQ